MATTSPELTRVERAALALGRLVNEQPHLKHWQLLFTREISRTWVRLAIAPRIYVDGGEWLVRLRPDRGVLMASNHRSFFDMYVTTLALFDMHAQWVERIFYPVRANFFYEHPLGVALNYMVGGGAMYPPIFRDAAKSSLNKDAVERITRFLAQPGTLVGVHPEGTRGKGPDPYELLPAQPGVGQMVLQGRPIVAPVFINGLPNDFRHGVGDTYRKNARRDYPIIICFGEELDYGELASQKPRASLYKRCADKMNETIRGLSEREREIRAACARGEIADSDPGWLKNH